MNAERSSTAPSPAQAVPSGHERPSYRRVLALAVPLMISMSGLVFMQTFDRALLGRYSATAVAAVGPAAMAFLLLTSLFTGACGFTSTLVAHYVGAGCPRMVGKAVWQGIHLSIFSGLAFVFLSPAARSILQIAGHAPDLLLQEATFFRISCGGAPAVFAANALGGFFSGRGDNRKLMAVQLGGFAVNAVLAYLLIFGKIGIAPLGIAGAAWATVGGQSFNAVALFALFLRREHRSAFGTWSGRRFDRALFARLLFFGLPNGARFMVDILAWTVFLFFVGRIGTFELAVTNVTWALNGIAFFPVYGLSIAVATLVGQSQGMRRPDLARSYTWRGLAVTEVWVALACALFVTAPEPLLRLFQDPESASLPGLIPLGTVLLRFVALYSLLDGVNILLIGALQGAGDTRWTLAMSLALNLGFVGVMAVMDSLHATLIAEWTAATVFILTQSGVWFWRFRSKRWEAMRVIENSGCTDFRLPRSDASG